MNRVGTLAALAIAACGSRPPDEAAFAKAQAFEQDRTTTASQSAFTYGLFLRDFPGSPLADQARAAITRVSTAGADQYGEAAIAAGAAPETIAAMQRLCIAAGERYHNLAIPARVEASGDPELVAAGGGPSIESIATGSGKPCEPTSPDAHSTGDGPALLIRYRATASGQAFVGNDNLPVDGITLTYAVELDLGDGAPPMEILTGESVPPPDVLAKVQATADREAYVRAVRYAIIRAAATNIELTVQHRLGFR
ncbi:MAG: hypothetical protein K8W52_38410 [Deltaproteobacteria bacterium]|nr:hypothetical protein [Deltaproteobacteria bacterium]